MSLMSRLPRLLKHLNPYLLPLARRRPPLAVVTHRGRRSGRTLHTPVQAFPTKSGFIMGLAYDANADWVLNLLAAGGGEITRDGRTYPVAEPRRRGADARAELPASAARMAQRLTDFLEVTTVTAGHVHDPAGT